MYEQVKAIQVKAIAESVGLYLVQFESPVTSGLYRQPVGNPSYRLVDKQGNIITYGTIETIYAYLTMRDRF